MKRYEEDDVMTCYFVVDDRGDCKTIRGWTDDKEYAKLYMDFHKCKSYKLKKMTDTFREVVKVIEENANDEITIYNMNTKNAKGKSKAITVPLTETEHTLINEEANTFISSRVNYGYINEAYYYLKGKYRKGLKMILLEDIMKNVVYSKNTKLVLSLEIDDLMVLFHSLSDQFGD